MKRVSLLTVCFVIISIGFLSAQTGKGKILTGLSSNISLGSGSDLMQLGYSSVKTKSDADGFEETDPATMLSFNLSPKIGYFVAENFAIGLDLNFGLLSTKDGEDEYEHKIIQSALSIGPFVRYYIPTEKVLPFFELGAAYGTGTTKFDYTDNTNLEDDEYKSSVMSLRGGVGLAAPLGEKVMFDVLAGYSSMTIKDIEDNPSNERTIMGTVGLKLGFTVLLGGE